MRRRPCRMATSPFIKTSFPQGGIPCTAILPPGQDGYQGNVARASRPLLSSSPGATGRGGPASIRPPRNSLPVLLDPTGPGSRTRSSLPARFPRILRALHCRRSHRFRVLRFGRRIRFRRTLPMLRGSGPLNGLRALRCHRPPPCSRPRRSSLLFRHCHRLRRHRASLPERQDPRLPRDRRPRRFPRGSRSPRKTHHRPRSRLDPRSRRSFRGLRRLPRRRFPLLRRSRPPWRPWRSPRLPRGLRHLHCRRCCCRRPRRSLHRRRSRRYRCPCRSPRCPRARPGPRCPFH